MWNRKKQAATGYKRNDENCYKESPFGVHGSDHPSHNSHFLSRGYVNNRQQRRREC